jgi:hypothetical protein
MTGRGNPPGTARDPPPRPGPSGFTFAKTGTRPHLHVATLHLGHLTWDVSLGTPYLRRFIWE